jgi:hypothetical protein
LGVWCRVRIGEVASRMSSRAQAFCGLIATRPRRSRRLLASSPDRQWSWPQVAISTFTRTGFCRKPLVVAAGDGQGSARGKLGDDVGVVEWSWHDHLLGESQGVDDKNV